MRKTFTLTKKLIPLKLIVLILLTFCFKHSYSQQRFERVYANSVQKSNDQYLIALVKTGYVNNENNAIDGNTSTFATLNSTVVQLLFAKVGGEAAIRLRFTGSNKPTPNTPVTIKLGIGGNLLSALSGITVQATNGAGNQEGNGNEVGPKYTGNELANLLSGKNQVEFTITPTQAYDGVKIKLGDTGGLLSVDAFSNLDVYHAYFLKPAASNIVCESVIDNLYGSTGILAGGLNPVDNPSRAFDKDENTYATLRTNVSALNTTFLTGVYSSLSKPQDSIRLILQEQGTGLLDATLLSAIRVQTFNNNTLSQNFTLSSPLLNLRLLGGSTNKYLLTLPTTTSFNRIRVSIGDGLVNALAGLRVYEISKTAPKPTITIPGLVNGTLTACEGAPINFTIATPEANATYKWFDAEQGGNEITTNISNNGASFSPQNLTPGTYNYFVALYRNGCSDPASGRSKVTLIITPGAKAADITATGTEICIGNTATIPSPVLANLAIENPVFKWYFDADKTTPITNGVFDGATYTINADLSLTITGLNATRNFYISVSGNNVCENPPGNLKSVTAIVNNIPQPTLNLAGDQTIGTGGTLTLTATSSNATSFQWYKNGAEIVGAVNSSYTITNASIADVGSYTVIALGSGCSSALSAAVNINIGGFGSTKSVSGLIDGKINAGSELIYKITVTNTGNTTLSGVTIQDIIPTGTSYIENSADNDGDLNEITNTLEWTVNIPAGTDLSVSFKVKVADNLTGIPSIGNTATITDPNNPGPPQTPSVPPIETNQIKDFNTYKSVDGLATGDKVKAGDILTYRIRVENTGNIPLTDIVITDPIPNGTTYVTGSASNNASLTGKLLTWDLDPIPFGGFTEVTFGVTVNANLTGIPTIGNIATVTYLNNPNIPKTAIDPPRATEPERKFTATKTIISGLNTNNKISPETELTFAITVVNEGNLDINGITIKDPIPAGTTYVAGSADNNGELVNGILNWVLDLPFGATKTVTFKVDVVKDLTGIPTIRNKATVTDPENPTTPEEPESPPTDTEPVRSFTSDKTVSGIINGKINANSELTYTISVKNTGNITLENITIKDPIPTGTTYVTGSANLGGVLTNNTLDWIIDIPVDETVDLTFKVNVASDLTNISAIGNTATVTDPGAPTNPPANPQNPKVDPIPTNQTPDFELSSAITTSNPAGKAAAGEELTVSITVKNTGNVALSNIVVTNLIPDNTTFKSTNGTYNPATNTITFNSASIAVGASQTFTFKVTADQNLFGITSIDNTANVKANTSLDENITASIGVICTTASVANVTVDGKTGGNICSSATNNVVITATSIGVTNPVYYLYLNNVLDRQSTDGIFTLTLTPGNTYTYTVGVSGSAFCETPASDRKSITFTVVQSPTTPTVTSANVSVCENTTATLSVSPINSAYVYSWFLTPTGGTSQGTGSTFTTPVITANTSYYVEASAGGCTSLARTEVKITAITAPATPASVTTNGPICTGSAATLMVDNPVNGIIYRWYTNLTGGSSVAEGNTFTANNLTETTTYYVESSSIATSCVSSTRLPVTVNVLPLLATPIVSLDSKTINSVTFRWNSVTGAVSYEYSTDGGISWQSIGSATSYTFSGLKPAENVSISVRAIANNACQNSSASAVITDSSDNPLGNEVFIPNTFTPNNDGNNDFFLVYGNTIRNINMRIYNQWGQAIFQSQQVTNGWNGTYKGQNQPTGVYVYSVELTFNDGSSTVKKGTITLIR